MARRGRRRQRHADEMEMVDRNVKSYDNDKTRSEDTDTRNSIFCILLLIVTLMAIFVFIPWICFKWQTKEVQEEARENFPHPMVPDNKKQYEGQGYKDVSYLKLSEDFQSITYNLLLKLNLEEEMYSGVVSIKFNIKERSDIMLHSRHLIIENIELGNDKISKIPIQSVLHPPQNIHYLLKEGLLIKNAASTNLSGEYHLEIKFKGFLNNTNMGLYKIQQRNKNSKESKKIITSLFQPIFARRVFPCFDEPSFKANFSIQIEINENYDYVILSNTPKISERKVENRKTLYFQETNPISTYMLAFFIGDFKLLRHYFTNKNGKPVEINIYVRQEVLSTVGYGLGISEKIVEQYAFYLGVPYSLSKLDIVIIPDLVCRSITQWGLISLGEAVFLYDEGHHSSEDKQAVAMTVALELAHNWFGNLVTMTWWDNLWMSAGFASFMKYKGVHRWEPTWKIKEQFLIEELHPVLTIDATSFSHPIINYVAADPDSILANFDEIAYNKAASILRMLEDIVGQDNFQSILIHYLKKYAYGNVDYQHFLQVLEEFVDTETIEFLNTFMNQAGYPVFTVQYTLDGKNNFNLTQKKFFLDAAAESNTTWNIPLRYRFCSDQYESNIIWFNQDQESMIIENPPGKLLKFNPDQIGYYRVNYPTAYWHVLRVNFKNLSTADKAHLLEESFSLSAAGQLTYNIPFGFTKQLANETNYILWKIAQLNLLRIEKLTNYTLVPFIRFITEHAYQTLGWEIKPRDDHLEELSRLTVLDITCHFKVHDCIIKAKEIFNKWFYQNQMISPGYRRIVYKYGMQNIDDEELVKHIFDKLIDETNISERLKLIEGLAYIHNATILKTLFNYFWNEEIIRRDEYLHFLKHLIDNREGTALAWMQITEKWNDLVLRHNVTQMSRIIRKTASNFKTQEQLEKVKEFFDFADKLNIGVDYNIRHQALEIVKCNIDWVEKYNFYVGDSLLIYNYDRIFYEKLV